METQSVTLGSGTDDRILSADAKSPKNFWRKPYFYVIIATILLAVIFLFFQFLSHKPEASSIFELSAVAADEIGVQPETGFILSAEKDYSEDQVKEFLEFIPETDYAVEKIAGDNADSRTGVAGIKYKIQPAESLEEGGLYQAVINNSDYAEREFSWAYQVKAPFQVSNVFPRNKGTGVALNSGIEITFNRQDPISPQDYFSINPSVSGNFESYGGTLIFKPERLEAEKVYTVTVKKSIRTSSTQEVIESDYVFRFETGSGEKVDESYSDYFYFNQDWMESLPGDKPMVPVQFGSDTNSGNIELSLYKFDNADDFMSSYMSSRQWDLYWSSFQNNYHYVPSQENKLYSFQAEAKEQNNRSFVEIPQEMEAGYYILYGNYRGENQEIWIQVNPLANYYSIAGKNGFLWIYDFRDRKPVSGASVTISLGGENSKNIGSTDTEGLLKFETPREMLSSENDTYERRTNFFKINSQGLPKVVRIYGQADEGKNYWSYISLDRPVYQLSDTVSFWGIVKGRQEDMKEKEVTISIREQSFYYEASNNFNSGLYASKKVTVTPFDTVQGELSFKGFSPGSYIIEASYDGTVIATDSFEVRTYSKPAYQISVFPDKDQVYTGTNVNFKIKAEFFDGTPVSNLDLRYEYYDNETEAKEIKLDNNGEAVISHTPEYREENYYPSTFQLNVKPKLAEEGDIYGSGNIQVFGPDLYLQSFNKPESNDKNTITAKLNSIIVQEKMDNSDEEGFYRQDYIGDPVKGYSLGATVIKTTYVEEEDGEYYDYINKVTRKKYRYNSVEEVLESFDGSTNNDGEWIFQKDFPKEENVSYKIEFSGTSQNGKKIKSTTYIFSRNSYEDPSDRYSASLKASGRTEKTYRSGEAIKLGVTLEGGEWPENIPVLFYRYRNTIDKIFTNSGLSLEENFSDELTPASNYAAILLGPQGFLETNSILIQLDKKEKNLKIGIEADKESYHPREKIKISFNVKDENNKPVTSQINAAAVDEAIFKVADLWQQKILDKLYEFPGGLLLTGATNYSLATGGEMGCFLAGTEVMTADGNPKPIEEIKTGDVIATIPDSHKQEKVLAVVQGISSHKVGEYMVINDVLKVTLEHRLFVNGNWIQAGNVSVGDTLMRYDGSPEIIRKIERYSGKGIPVYNIIVGKYHTYFADGYYVHNEEKGGEARSNFMDTASFQSVGTKSDGEATMEFTAPDNVTSWRLTAKAFSPEKILAGESIKLIKTSLPFFTEAALSNLYMEDDEPVIKIRAFGDDYRKGQNVNFSVKSKSLGLDENLDSSSNTIYVSLGKLKEGDHPLLITAKQGRNTDSISRKIQVVESYMRKIATKTYELNGSLEKIEGNKSGMTTIVFSDSGKGKYYPTAEGIKWNTGLRADEVVSRYMAQQILKDYFGYEGDITAPELQNYYSENGSITLFPKYGSEDLDLSAKISDAAGEFAESAKLTGYFQKTLADQNSGMHQAVISLYGLASLKQPVLDKIGLAQKNAKKLELQDKIYLALAKAKIGDKESARSFYASEIRPDLEFNGDEGWVSVGNDETLNIKLTATTAYLIALIDYPSDLQKFWNYLEKNQPDRDLDSLERVMTIKADIGKIKGESGEVRVVSSVRDEKIVLENGMSQSLTVTADELASLKIASVKGGVSLVSYFEAPTEQSAIAKDERIGIERRFENVADSSNNFKEGDLVRIILSPHIMPTAPDGTYQIVDFLPSGLRPVTRLYDHDPSLEEGAPCNPTWYPSRIENNTVYFNISKDFEREEECQIRSMVYYARIVSRGTYKADPVVIQAESDPAILNSSSENKIEIQ